jgi:uncharacterized protein (DUF302 family)
MRPEAAGFTVFTEIDHAAAAKKFGLDMRPRTVIVFGNPEFGTSRHGQDATVGDRRAA